MGEFLFGEDALKYARSNLVEFALLDIEMKGMNGVELAKELRKLYPEGNAEARFKIGGTRYLYYYCNRHGLFRAPV